MFFILFFFVSEISAGSVAPASQAPQPLPPFPSQSRVHLAKGPSRQGSTSRRVHLVKGPPRQGSTSSRVHLVGGPAACAGSKGCLVLPPSPFFVGSFLHCTLLLAGGAASSSKCATSPQPQGTVTSFLHLTFRNHNTFNAIVPGGSTIVGRRAACSCHSPQQSSTSKQHYMFSSCIATGPPRGPRSSVRCRTPPLPLHLPQLP
jgi:hypothetical protein